MLLIDNLGFCVQVRIYHHLSESSQWDCLFYDEESSMIVVETIAESLGFVF